MIEHMALFDQMLRATARQEARQYYLPSGFAIRPESPRIEMRPVEVTRPRWLHRLVPTISWRQAVATSDPCCCPA